jgi:hypothetical protein
MEASDPIKNICKKHLQVGAVHIWEWKLLRQADKPADQQAA